MKLNTLYYGDCLEVMGSWPPNSVDLIYLDPPFNSNTDYSILFGREKSGHDKNALAQLMAFTDMWEWNAEADARVRAITGAIAHPAHKSISAFNRFYTDGSGMLSYLSYMAERLAVMAPLLKQSGGIYLHCDPTAGHYLKMVMDEIFGVKNFRNEIIWKKTNSPKSQSKTFGNQHDIILYYSKSDGFDFSEVKKPADEKYLRSFRYADDAGKYQTVALSNTTPIGGFGKMKVWEWRGVNARWIYAKDTLEKLWSENKIVKTKTGYRKKVYLHEVDGPVVSDIWVDKGVAPIQGMAKERLGYPTQKPLALLERIIRASSKKGGVVLDPFCGCGTTIEAALNLKRKWIGIDISAYAIEVIRRERLNNLKIPIEGIPKDFHAAEHFAKAKPFEFEKWAVTRVRGFAPNTVQVGDSGIDGRALIWGLADGENLCIAQIKGGTPHIESLRAFAREISADKAAMGIFITLRKFDTPAVKKCVADAGKIKIGDSEYNRLALYSIEQYFDKVPAPLPALTHPRTGKPFQDELLDLED